MVRAARRRASQAPAHACDDTETPRRSPRIDARRRPAPCHRPHDPASDDHAFDTPVRGLTDITHAVDEWLRGSRLETGLLTLFIRHTSASLIVQESADPAALADLDRFLARLVPISRDWRLRFSAEHGMIRPDDVIAGGGRIAVARSCPAHAILTPPSSGRRCLPRPIPRVTTSRHEISPVASGNGDCILASEKFTC
ncbi:YjbQ family protein [Variovorax paradoxus]|nr:YjbQ family protein [Variovorax paradoxus]